MTNGYRDGAFALGLTVGVFSTLIVFVYGEQAYELVKCITGSEDYCRYRIQEGENEPEWWEWTRALVKFEDSIAQWIIALLTVIATGLLLGTFWQAFATNRAVAHTNEIMLAEQRPWIKITGTSLERIEISGGNLTAFYSVNYENVGHRPAVEVASAFAIVDLNETKVSDKIREAVSLYEKRKDTFTRGVTFFGEGQVPDSLVTVGVNYSREADYRIILLLTYRDPAREETCFTANLYTLTRIIDDDEAEDIGFHGRSFRVSIDGRLPTIVK